MTLVTPWLTSSTYADHDVSAATIRAFLAGEVDAEALPEPTWGPIGLEVFQRTYARDVDGRLETWAETCRRVVNGSLSYIDRSLWLPYEDVELFQLLYRFAAVPAGRHLWVTGTHSSHMSHNCWASGYGVRPSDHMRYLAARLFEGGGVGSNYSSDLMEHLPPVTGYIQLAVTCRAGHADIEAVRQAAGHSFVNGSVLEHHHALRVEDTREGWVSAWGELVDLAHRPGSHIVLLDVSDIRPYGSPLLTFGGRASGPGPFVRAAMAIVGILNGAAEDGAANSQPRRLSGLETMQIDHEVAAAVVAGGSRRSARMSMMHWRDEDIFDFIACKTDQMQHWSTNISVEIDDDFAAAVEAGDAHATRVLREVAEGMALNGEPGLVNTSAHSLDEYAAIRITNPCLRGDSMLLTRDGLVPIRDLVGVEFELWNGRSWSRSTAWSTGIKEVFEVRLSNGTTISATANHVFATADGEEVPVAELLGKKLCLLPGAEWDGADPYSYDEALLLGFLQGDGTKRADCGAVSVKNNEPEVSELLSAFGFHRETSGDWYAGASTPAALLVAKAEMLDEHLPHRTLPPWLFTARPATVKAFLRGLYSANGAALARHRRVVLKSTCRELVNQVQQLLCALGISSYITTNKPTTIAWPNGSYVSQESYDLNIGNADGLSIFKSEIGFLHAHKTANLHSYNLERRAKPRSFTVVEVTSVGDAEVFDFHEPQRHWGWANGLQAHNCGEVGLRFDPADAAGESCNLGSVNLDYFARDDAGAVRAFELMARFLYRSTLNPHHDEPARRIEARNRRIGVGIMGLQGWCAAHGVRLSQLAEASELHRKLEMFRQAARRAADDLADTLGTPRSVKVTAVAPTGTIAQLSGTTPGIHPVMARYFIRRVRFADSDPQLEAYRSIGYNVVPDIYAAHTSIVEFVVRDQILDRYPAELIEQSDELSAAQFFDLIATIQRHFCSPGDGNAISATAQIAPDTDPSELVAAIRPHLRHLKGMTVFPKVSRELAPYEPLTEAEYLERLAAGHVAAIGDSNDGECLGGACPIR